MTNPNVVVPKIIHSTLPMKSHDANAVKSSAENDRLFLVRGHLMCTQALPKGVCAWCKSCDLVTGDCGGLTISLIIFVVVSFENMRFVEWSCLIYSVPLKLNKLAGLWALAVVAHFRATELGHKRNLAANIGGFCRSGSAAMLWVLWTLGKCRNSKYLCEVAG